MTTDTIIINGDNNNTGENNYADNDCNNMNDSNNNDKSNDFDYNNNNIVVGAVVCVLRSTKTITKGK